MNKQKTLLILLAAVGVLVIILTVIILSERDEKMVPVVEEEPLVFELEFDQEGMLKEEIVPPVGELLKALSSENLESVQSAVVMIQFLSRERYRHLWPSDLSEEDIYKHIDRILAPEYIDHLSESDNMEILHRVIAILDPRRGLSGYYRTEEHIQRVKEAIERWNATQSKWDASYSFFELVLDEDGNPKHYGGKFGGHSK